MLHILRLKTTYIYYLNSFHRSGVQAWLSSGSYKATQNIGQAAFSFGVQDPLPNFLGFGRI